jgi:hypothetical protein
MAEPAVIVEKDGHVLTVTLNRPEKRNAVNCEVMCRHRRGRSPAGASPYAGRGSPLPRRHRFPV